MRKGWKLQYISPSVGTDSPIKEPLVLAHTKGGLAIHPTIFSSKKGVPEEGYITITHIKSGFSIHRFFDRLPFSFAEVLLREADWTGDRIADESGNLIPRPEWNEAYRTAIREVGF